MIWLITMAVRYRTIRYLLLVAAVLVAIGLFTTLGGT